MAGRHVARVHPALDQDPAVAVEKTDEFDPGVVIDVLSAVRTVISSALPPGSTIGPRWVFSRRLPSSVVSVFGVPPLSETLTALRPQWA